MAETVSVPTRIKAAAVKRIIPINAFTCFPALSGVSSFFGFTVDGSMFGSTDQTSLSKAMGITKPVE
ncbi:hypothetical protein EMG21_30255 [Klebsiella pneumoniae]|nr:hypothetical protein EMG21_30255 [Klebsiella pneumoniae]